MTKREKKCKSVITGEHKWRWETVTQSTDNTGCPMREVAERCVWCKQFKGGETKWEIIANKWYVPTKT